MHTEFWSKKLEGKTQLGRLRHRWEDAVKMDLRDIGWEDMNWIHLVHDRDHCQVYYEQ
jgi:hypothetical protein